MNHTERKKYVDNVRSEVARLARLIDVQDEDLPVADRAEGGAWLSLDWHEADDGDDEDGWRLTLFRNESGHDWSIAEVGLGYEDYLLYVLFDQITAAIAMGQVASLEQSAKKRRWFSIQESLLATLNPAWGARAARDHARILARDED